MIIKWHRLFIGLIMLTSGAYVIGGVLAFLPFPVEMLLSANIFLKYSVVCLSVIAVLMGCKVVWNSFKRVEPDYGDYWS